MSGPISQPLAQGVRKAGRLGRVAALALAAVAVITGTAYGAEATGGGPAKDSTRAAGWTRALNVDLSARDLSLPASASARRLAKAALTRTARRLGVPRSLRGVRVAGTRHVPVGPRGARELDLMRFQQTVRGVRVLWSQIDIAVASGRVSSIAATVVPVTGKRLTGERRVSRTRALRIARRAVAGPEQALQPLPVAYAGKPTTSRDAKARAPRRAWVVETTPASARDAETSTPLCVVVDAETGKVLARWWGIADRPDRGPQARGALTASAGRNGRLGGAAARAAQTDRGNGMLNVRDGSGLYASFVVDGDPHRGVNWPAFTDSAPWNKACIDSSAPLPCVNYRGAYTDVMDAVATNARNVAFTICAVRDYCGKVGGLVGDTDRFHLAWQVIGNAEASVARRRQHSQSGDRSRQRDGRDPTLPHHDRLPAGPASPRSQAALQRRHRARIRAHQGLRHRRRPLDRSA